MVRMIAVFLERKAVIEAPVFLGGNTSLKPPPP
jgi:hypothetical protein